VRVPVPVLGAFSFAVVGSADGDQHTCSFFYYRIGIPPLRCLATSLSQRSWSVTPGVANIGYRVQFCLTVLTRCRPRVSSMTYGVFLAEANKTQ
jgi:hypothetical protein